MSAPADIDVIAVARAAFVAVSATEKAQGALALARRVAEHGPIEPIPQADAWPDEPGRPALPLLMPPARVPRRSTGGVKGRISLLHALAHIEFTAIDLALDLLGRFSGAPELGGLRCDFVTDWSCVAGEEATHFLLVEARLRELGSFYGALPAHGELWRAASRSAHDLAQRLAIGPLVLEARGLDVTPGMIARLTRDGDTASAAILERIYRDEIGHVRVGVRWFETVCAARRIPARMAFRSAVETLYAGGLKPPFNHEARDAAGFPASFLLDDSLSSAG